MKKFKKIKENFLLAKWFVFSLAFVFAVNLVFAFSYPLNVGYSDNPNYLIMIHSGVSNLIHASGYPLVVKLFFDAFGIRPGETIFDQEWLTKIHVMQVLLHSVLFACNATLVRSVFGNVIAIVFVLIIGLSVLFMGAVNSAAPEWLQGDLILLALLLSIKSYLSINVRVKWLGYVLAYAVFGIGYLVKFNSLIVLPFLVAIVAVDSKSLCWKSGVLLACGLASLAVIQIFVWTFHFPTTKSRQLTYDHAWVLIQSIPDGYFLLPPENLGVNTLRWMVLSSIVPKHYSVAGAYASIDTGAPADVRDSYFIKYRQVMRMPKDALVDFVNNHPYGANVNKNLAAIPLYWYIGLKEADDLGIEVFKESIGLWYQTYLSKVIHGFSVWGGFQFQVVPFCSNGLGLNFPCDGLEGGGYNYSVPEGSVPQWNRYWNPSQTIWAPGAKVIEWAATLVLPRVVEIFICFLSIISLFFLRIHKDLVVRAVLFLFIVAFSSSSYVLVGMRDKEYTSLLPVLALFYSFGVSFALETIKNALRK